MVVQMKDVAERAGVSLSTGSFVLNKKRIKSISPETSRRVWAVAQELNYHVNVHARRLARGQSNLVGLIISEIANPFFPDVIRGFELAATQVKIVTGTSQHFATVSTAGSYLSSKDKRVHFGLGADAEVQKIEIRWPSGILQTLHRVAV